jgi:hypothetical protein
MRFPVDITTQMSLRARDIKGNGTLADDEFRLGVPQLASVGALTGWVFHGPLAAF